MNGKNLIKVIIEGRPEDDGDARFDVFIQQLDNILKLLEQADKTLFGKKAKSYFKVADLSHSSPATITVEKKYENAQFFGKVIEDVDEYDKLFSDMETSDIKLLERFQAVIDYTAENLKGTEIQFPKKDVYSFNEKMNKKVSKALINNGVSKIDSLEAVVSYSGFLRELNIDVVPNTFSIFPLTGIKKIKCQSPNSLQDTLKLSVGKKIAVKGRGKYEGSKPFPIMIDVKEIIPYEYDKSLPSLKELCGAEEGITKGKSAAEIVRDIRNEWD